MTTTTFQLAYCDTVGFVADQGGRGFHLPMAMVIRSDGRIFVASRSNTQALDIVGIQMVNLKHEFFGQISEYGQAKGQMIWPTALALDHDENLYLADDYLQRITVFDREGTVKDCWGTKGSGDGEFDGVSGLLFDRDDNLLVVDHRNHRIQTFTKDGQFLGTWGSFGDGDGQFNLPWGITQDNHGYLYIADWRNDRIQKFTPDGRFVAKYGSSGDADGQFNRPSGLGVDADGNMYVADWGNQRVQVLDAEGNLLLKLRGEATLSPWASEYLQANADEFEARSKFVPNFAVDTDDINEESARIEPYFWDPVDVVLDDEDRVYVLETSRHRFQIYQKR
ncbi:MAG: NHL repeat-containing protein [Candidatus Tectomicrobia bacterium]|nr:NHL repeat-containing protein [Candidatus Tectomicrobia bacterium]